MDYSVFSVQHFLNALLQWFRFSFFFYVLGIFASWSIEYRRSRKEYFPAPRLGNSLKEGINFYFLSLSLFALFFWIIIPETFITIMISIVVSSIVGFYVCCWNSKVNIVEQANILMLAGTFVTVFIALAAFIKIDYFSEKAKIDLVAKPCFGTLTIGRGEEECLDLVRLEQQYHSDKYLRKYVVNQLREIYSGTYALALRVPVYRRVGASDNFVEETFNDLNLGNVYGHMKHFFGGSQTKACYLVQGVSNELIRQYGDKDITWEKILDRLIELVQDDKEEFPVRIMAQIVYSKLAGIGTRLLVKKDDPFGFQDTTEDWKNKNNKDRILENLKSSK